MTYNSYDSLTTESIRKYIDDYSLIKAYFSEFKGIGKYRSNLRNDDINHSLSFISRNSKITVSDFGRKDFIGMTTFKYLQYLLGFEDNKEGYMMLLDKIVDDFKLPISRYNKPYTVDKQFVLNTVPKIHNVKLENKQNTKIEYKKREWFSFPIDESFWGIITNKDELVPLFKLYKIYPLSYYWINNIRFEVKQDNPVYLFKNQSNTKYKLYAPFDLHYKWVSTMTLHDVIGLDSLTNDDYLLIEKSAKDTIIAKVLGINSIPMNSESSFLGEKIIKKLKEKYRLIAHFDNDKSGIEAAKKYADLYEISTFTFPEDWPKDNYDFLKNDGQKKKKKNYLLTQIKIN